MNRPALALGIVVITLIVAVFDFRTSASLVGAILFTLPLALCALHRSRVLLWGTAIAASVLTISAPLLGVDGGYPPDTHAEFVNRGLLIASLLTLTMFIHLWISRGDEAERSVGELKRQSERTSETTHFLNNVLESSVRHSIIATDLEGGILTWNQGAFRNYGYTSEEMVGKANSLVLHTQADIDSGRAYALRKAAIENGNAEEVFSRQRKSGECFPAAVSMTVRCDTSGKPIGYLIISQDVTARQQLEEDIRGKTAELEKQYGRVQEANRLKSEFLANMSHELRTPLNAIIGFSELIYDGKAGAISAQQKEYTGDVLASARHLLQLINDVLDLAKVESGKMEFHAELLDLPRIVNEVCDVVRTLLAAKRLVLRIDVDSAPGDVILDPRKFKQVVYNYLSNAIKFTEDGGTITIRVAAEGDDYFRLNVTDTGIGVKASDVERLFVEFQQLDTSSSKTHQGTGLGLALVQRIVGAQGGHVGVDSNVGQGSCFWAVLPRNTRAHQQAERADTATLRTLAGVPVVLVVDDDPRDCARIELALTLAGYAVETAASGAEAIARCRKYPFAGITLDLLLPDSNGWEVLSSIRAQGPNMTTPVIVVSIVVDKAAAIAFKAQDYLTKPFQATELVTLLRHHGVHASSTRTVLIVDDDLPAVSALRERLEHEGYHTLHAATTAEAHTIFGSFAPPEAAVINAEMMGDGFELLAQMRIARAGRDIPIIVIARRALQPHELEQLRHDALPIVAKGERAGEAVVAELRAILAKSASARLAPVA